MNWLIENWKLILEVVVLVISVVMFILKKKPIKVVDSVCQRIMKYLPGVIRSVEKFSVGKGDEKLNEAILMVHGLLSEDLDLTPEECLQYDSFIRQQVENILDTPQKKGENDGKKNS